MLDISNWSPDVVAAVTLGLLFLIVVAVIGGMCMQAGLFYTIHIKTQKPEFGELTVYYKCGRGAYSESGAMFTACHSLMPQYNTIGVYYDDPVKKASAHLRYIVGLVLSEGGAEVDPQDEATLESEGYQKAMFPAVKHAVVADFPYKSTLSCIFAVFRVYPALREYVERRELCAHPIIELYDNKSQRILFAGPLELQDSFYVPEVLQEDEEGEMSCDPGSGQDDDSAASECSARDSAAPEELEEEEAPTNWEKSASLLHDDGCRANDNGDSAQQGSACESETNTASSFEEIDPSEAVAASVPLPDLPLDTTLTDTPLVSAAAAAAAADTSDVVPAPVKSDEKVEAEVVKSAPEEQLQSKQEKECSPQKQTESSSVSTE